jgi:hypothetical protein
MTQTHRLKSALLSAATLLFAISGNAGEPGNQRSKYSLEGEHQFAFTVGALVDSAWDDTPAIGTLDYSYWFSEQAAVTITLGGIADSSRSARRQFRDKDDEGVGILHVGMQLRPDFFNLSDRVFFTLQGTVGTYVGTEWYYIDWRDSEHRHGYWRERTETRWGAYLGLNLNVGVTRHILIGASAGYHFVDTFDGVIMGVQDYSSPDFRLHFSFVL